MQLIGLCFCLLYRAISAWSPGFMDVVVWIFPYQGIGTGATKKKNVTVMYACLFYHSCEHFVVKIMMKSVQTFQLYYN